MKGSQYAPIKNDLKSYINHVRFIFKYRDQLTEKEYQELKNLQLLYKLNDKYYLDKASNCYLSDYYQPYYPLESIVDDLSRNNFKFIASDYCENNSEILKWREFFLKINIIKPNGIEIITRFIIPMIRRDEINEDNTIKITQFIHKVLQGKEISNELKLELSHLPLITGSGLQEACNCYLSDFYTDFTHNSQFLNEIKLENLISSAYKNDQSREGWRQFFISIGVKEINGFELIKHKISLLKNNSTWITAENAISITTEIFSHYNELSQDDFDNLQALPILLKNGGLAPANKCYLSKKYQPIQDLEDLFATTDFDKIISDEYINQNNNVQLWKKFFLKIGVAEGIRISIIKERSPMNFNKELWKSYLQFIGINYPNNYQIENLVFIIDIEKYSNNYQFSIKLWRYLVQHWKKLNLEINSKIWINQYTPKTVISFFKFIVTQYPSIPCLDQKCHKPENVYSALLAKELRNLDILISAVNLPAEIEDFLGIKRVLDLNIYLRLLSASIGNHTLRFYKLISEIINKGLNAQDKELLIEWRKTGKILACDDNLYPISELYYLDSDLGLPSKRNLKLVKYSEECQAFYDFIEIKKITEQDIQRVSEGDKVCDILRNLIKARVSLISIYLVNSTDTEIVRYQNNKILKCLGNLSIHNPAKLYCRINKINYDEPIYNFHYENHKIDYVGRWNSRKNARIGDYLIQELELNSKKISSERLLDFLDDPIEEILDYFRKSGFDLLKTDYDSTSNDTQKSDKISQQEPVISTVINGSNGTGDDAEYWGGFGEEHAKLFYEKLGYIVTKQPDLKGYDFLCQKQGNNDQLNVEVKTINPKHNDVIRITINEWKTMCKLESHYEIFIILHIGHSITKAIRIKSAWRTLQEVFYNLNLQSLTSCEYKKQIEFLVGFQRNDRNTANDILLNWKRLEDQTLNSIENIRIE